MRIRTWYRESKDLLHRMSKHITDKLRTIYSESYNILSTIIGSILVSTPASFSNSISSSSIELKASKLPAAFEKAYRIQQSYYYGLGIALRGQH